MKVILTLATLLLCGCATTCRDHPVACGVAAGIVIGAVILAAEGDNRGDRVTVVPKHRRMSPCQPLGVTPCGP